MHPKLLGFRYKLFRYRWREQAIAQQPNIRRMIDVGCGDGENLLRFSSLPAQRVGLEISWPRLQKARAQGLDVLQGTATRLPISGAGFDFVYIAHVLHHVHDYAQVLRELRRVLAPDGYVFIVETVTDHPLLRLGRAIHPIWQGDAVAADWRYAELVRLVQDAGFEIEETDRYNLLFFLWEMLPLAFWPFELFTPLFVYLDLFLARFLRRYSAHCYFVLRHRGAPA
jgi:ubiquinone/menaquinone biosynthesis C-methylase UbiE